MGSPQKHFSTSKLKKLSKAQLSALQKELKRHIRQDPMLRALARAHKEMTKRLTEKVVGKFPELRSRRRSAR